MAMLSLVPRSRAAWCILVGLVFGGAARAQVFSGELIDVGPYPIDVDAADLDSNGELDLVVATWNYSGHVSVVLANGPGSFLDPVDYAAHDATSLVIADYDNDGHLDVAAAINDYANPPSSSVTLYLGSGTGALVFAGAQPIGPLMYDLEAGDFDQDGLPDLAASSWVAGVVEVGINQGSATFGSFAPVGTFTEPHDLAVVDLDGDGSLDLVVPDAPSQVVVLRGTGTGSFVNGPVLPVCNGVVAAVVADLVPGGGLDLACACSPGLYYDVPTGTSVEIRASDGAGGYSLFDSELVTARPNEIASGDVDGDGRIDLAVATFVDYAVLRNSSAGLASPEYWAGPSVSRDVELVDVEADGRLDLLGVDDHLRILRGLGEGELEGARVRKYGTPQAAPVSTPFAPPIGLAAADLDGDGVPDVVVPQQDGTLEVLLGDGDAGLLAPAAFATGAKIQTAHAAQVDGDGNVDLLLVGSDPPALYSHLGDGLGGVGPPSSIGLASVPKDSAVGDFDDDGDADIAVALGSSVQVVHASGSGFSGSPLVLDLSLPPDVVAAGDLNLDGHLDLAAMGWKYTYGGFSSKFSDPVYRVYLADASGGFTSLSTVGGFDLAPKDLAFGDVNGDGKLDMLALGQYWCCYSGAWWNPRLRRYLGTGNGTFAGTLDLEPEYDSTAKLWVGDVTGDGQADALIGGHLYVELFRATGGGQFSEASEHSTGSGGRDGALIDLDGDGWLDIARTTTSNTPWWWQPGVSVLPHVGLDVAGASAFGSGTPGCAGALAITANSPPKVGNPFFALVGTGVAPGAHGWGYLASVPDPLGSDPFSLGLLLHLDPLAGGPLVPFQAKSGTWGAAIAKLPIPIDPQLVNAVVYAQEFWLPPPWQACGDAAFGLVSSRGMRLTVQP